MNDSQRPEFLYYGHSTVSFTLPGGEVVLIDPWVRHNPACPESLHEMERLDAMLITHSHPDHFADAVVLATRLRPRTVVANYEICHWLAAHGVDNVAPMNPGGSQEVLGCRVTMVRADHSSSIEDGGGLLYGGSAAGFVVETPSAGSGFRFYHAGDTALFSDMELIADLYRPEIGFVPVGDLFTMGPAEAALACKLLRLQRVVPIHYGTFPVLTGTPEEFGRELERLSVNCEVVTLEPGAKL